LLWEELKEQIKQNLNQAYILENYSKFIHSYLSDPSLFPNYNRLDKDKKELFGKSLMSLANCRFIDVGSLSHIELAFAAALFFVAKGTQVFIFTFGPVDLNHYSEFFEACEKDFAIKIGVVDKSVDGSERGKIYQRDIVVADYILFTKDFYRDNGLVNQKDITALFCNFDLCLYDRRIFFFESEYLQFAGAVYHSKGGSVDQKGPFNIVDYRNILPMFTHKAGLCSGITKELIREMNRVYGIMIDGADKFIDRKMPALVFEDKKEKIRVLCDDIAKANGYTLVFCELPETFSSLTKELNDRGSKVTSIFSDSELVDFFSRTGKEKPVGLVRGMVRFDTPDAISENDVTVVLAEHYLFLHHHTKIRILCNERLNCKSAPKLYFSLDDEMARIYTEEGNFTPTFKLMKFTEKRYRKQLVRKWIAQRILKKVYRMRRFLWNENCPVLTTVFFSAPQKKSKSAKHSKDIRKSLSSLCFCGSGKKFKDCHGK